MKDHEQIPKPNDRENFLIYSNGVLARFRSPVEIEQKDKGETYIQFEIRPTERMKYKHHIQQDEYDRNSGYITVSYPKSLCKLLDPDPDSSKWFIFCDYRGNEVTNSMSNWSSSFITTIRSLVRQINHYKLLLAKQSHDFGIASKHPEQSMDRNLKTIEKVKDSFKLRRPEVNSNQGTQLNEEEASY